MIISINLTYKNEVVYSKRNIPFDPFSEGDTIHLSVEEPSPRLISEWESEYPKKAVNMLISSFSESRDEYHLTKWLLGKPFKHLDILTDEVHIEYPLIPVEELDVN